MTIYIINVLFVICLRTVYSSNFKFGEKHIIKGRRMYAIIICLMFSLLMSLRNISVGVDTAPYSRIFAIIGSSGSLKQAFSQAPLTAPVYVLLCWLLYHVSSDPQILTFASSLFIIIGFFKFIEKASDDIVTSCNCWIGLTMLYASMNGTRQFMAIVLVLNALYYLAENFKSVKGWVLLILAIGIHSTAIFSFIAILGIVLANKLKENKLIFITSVIVSGLVSVGFSRVLPYVIRLIPRYAMYTNGISEYNILVNSGGGRIILLYLFLLAITILWVFSSRKGNVENDAFNSRMLPAVVFGSVFGIFNAKNELMNRMLWFYISIFVTFIPSTIKKYRGNTRRVIEYGILIGLYIYSFISLAENQNGVVPYIFFWN